MVERCKDCKKELKFVHGIQVDGQSGYCQKHWDIRLVKNKKGLNKRWGLKAELVEV